MVMAHLGLYGIYKHLTIKVISPENLLFPRTWLLLKVNN